MGTEMKRALLFGSVPCGDGAFLRPYLDGGGWTVFCADGGVRNARAAGLRPDYLIGDWDSGGAPEGDVPCITLPVEKDMTDLQAAVIRHWSWITGSSCCAAVLGDGWTIPPPTWCFWSGSPTTAAGLCWWMPIMRCACWTAECCG